MKFLAPAEQLCIRTPLIKLWLNNDALYAIHLQKMKFQFLSMMPMGSTILVQAVLNWDDLRIVFVDSTDIL